jgi:hypothetical protein
MSRGAGLTDQDLVGMFRARIPYILFGTVFLFVGLCACGVAVMRRGSCVKLLTWLGIWSTIEGTEYLFGSLADLGLLPNWLLEGFPYVGNILSFSVVVIAVLAFMQLSQGKLRLFLQGAIVAGLAIAVAGIALFLLTGSSFKVMPYNHLVAAISLTVLATIVAVPKLSRKFLVLREHTVLSVGILLFAIEAVYGNLSLPLRLPSPPEILDPMGFAILLFSFGYVAVESLESISATSTGGFHAADCPAGPRRKRVNEASSLQPAPDPPHHSGRGRRLPGPARGNFGGETRARRRAPARGRVCCRSDCRGRFCSNPGPGPDARWTEAAAVLSARGPRA